MCGKRAVLGSGCCRAFVLFFYHTGLCSALQVASTGFTAAKSGLDIAAGGLTVGTGARIAGGLGVTSGNVLVKTGALQVTPTGQSVNALDVLSSSTTNVITGRVPAGSAGNAMSLFVTSGSTLFQVSVV